jgi:hypothetical protein
VRPFDEDEESASLERLKDRCVSLIAEKGAVGAEGFRGLVQRCAQRLVAYHLLRRCHPMTWGLFQMQVEDLMKPLPCKY